MINKYEFPKKHDLRRFHEAQQHGIFIDNMRRGTDYQTAFNEITRSGRKMSCWMWYIFPQLIKSETSDISIFYGITDLKEACDYLRDPILFERYSSLLYQVSLRLRERSLISVMGGKIDADKLVCSITLFRLAAIHIQSQEMKDPLMTFDLNGLINHCSTIFSLILNQNFTECRATQQALTPTVPRSYIPSQLIREQQATPMNTQPQLNNRNYQEDTPPLTCLQRFFKLINGSDNDTARSHTPLLPKP